MEKEKEKKKKKKINGQNNILGLSKIIEFLRYMSLRMHYYNG